MWTCSVRPDNFFSQSCTSFYHSNWLLGADCFLQKTKNKTKKHAETHTVQHKQAQQQRSDQSQHARCFYLQDTVLTVGNVDRVSDGSCAIIVTQGCKQNVRK